jgi:hypothetical protein
MGREVSRSLLVASLFTFHAGLASAQLRSAPDSIRHVAEAIQRSLR